jgi:hypothetical protein
MIRPEWDRRLLAGEIDCATGAGLIGATPAGWSKATG